MPTFKTHKDVIDLWPTTAEFARAIGASPGAARNWRVRGIPPTLFNDVIRAAVKAGFDAPTYRQLTDMMRSRQGT